MLRIGINTSGWTVQEISRLIHYWKHKRQDPTLHNGRWGGARNFLFDPPGRICRYVVLSRSVGIHGSLGVPLSRKWISRLLQRLDYTQKVVNYRQKEKFTVGNVQYYGLYVVCISTIHGPALSIVTSPLPCSRLAATRVGSRVSSSDGSERHVAVSPTVSLW